MQTHINFNQPRCVGREAELVEQVLKSTNTSGDGPMTKSVQGWFQFELHMRVLPTTSCSSALDMAAILSDIGPGMPSLSRVTRLCLQPTLLSCAEQRPFLRIQRRTVLTWDLKKSSPSTGLESKSSSSCITPACPTTFLQSRHGARRGHHARRRCGTIDGRLARSRFGAKAPWSFWRPRHIFFP